MSFDISVSVRSCKVKLNQKTFKVTYILYIFARIIFSIFINIQAKELNIMFLDSALPGLLLPTYFAVILIKLLRSISKLECYFLFIILAINLAQIRSDYGQH